MIVTKYFLTFLKSIQECRKEQKTEKVRTEVNERMQCELTYFVCTLVLLIL